MPRTNGNAPNDQLPASGKALLLAKGNERIPFVLQLPEKRSVLEPLAPKRRASCLVISVNVPAPTGVSLPGISVEAEGKRKTKLDKPPASEKDRRSMARV